MFEITLGGLKIRINFLFVAMVCIFLLTDKTNVSVMGLLACLMHESGHIAAFFAVGCTPSLLSFDVTGIKLVNPQTALSAGRELFILISGSGVNLLTAALTCSASPLFCLIHLVLGLFNLLPIKSFDGGKLLSLVLSSLFPLRAADILCSIFDLLSVAVLAALCLCLIINVGFSFTLAVMTSYLILCAVMKLRS